MGTSQEQDMSTGTGETTPPIPSAGTDHGNPYDLGAAKSPRDAGMMGHADGGARFEGSTPDSTTY
jgi:hypothetical protein